MGQRVTVVIVVFNDVYMHQQCNVNLEFNFSEGKQTMERLAPIFLSSIDRHCNQILALSLRSLVDARWLVYILKKSIVTDTKSLLAPPLCRYTPCVQRLKLSGCVGRCYIKQWRLNS